MGGHIEIESQKAAPDAGLKPSQMISVFRIFLVTKREISGFVNGVWRHRRRLTAKLS